jgi:hypothetical protein
MLVQPQTLAAAPMERTASAGSSTDVRQVVGFAQTSTDADRGFLSAKL